MSIIKETIRLVPINITGLTTNIKFGLSSNDGFLGYQQEIDNLTQVVSLDIVNPNIDVEERKIKYIPGIGPLTLQFNFHVPPGNAFLSTFLLAGFGPNDIVSLTSNMLNSFFILDFYDTYDINTQTKIFSVYLTKLIVNDAFGNKVYIPTYTIGGSVPNQFYYWYTPKWFLDSFTGSTTGYTKFSFYNAITGSVTSFFNPDNDTIDVNGYVNPKRMYWQSTINKVNKTWQIYTPPSHNNVVIANQLWASPAYNDKVDNTVQNFNNEQQDYPSGNTFNYLNGTYETL